MEGRERIPQLTRLAFENVVIDLTSSDGRHYAAALPDRLYAAEVLDATADRLELALDGRRLVAYVSEDPRGNWVTIDGRTFRLQRPAAPAHAASSHRGPAELIAPMPGQVRAVHVSAGDIVTKGHLLVVLEAMKMEIRLSAAFDAQVVSVEVHVGQTVERQQVVARLQPPATTETA